MNHPPAKTITFLFTDIEGSTKLWQQHPETMNEALCRHNALLNESISAHSGNVFKIIGDAFCAAFSTANDGLDAALEAQRCLATQKWGEIGVIRVRMAIHTGRAEGQASEFASAEYSSGLTLCRTARLLSAGHGGQILLSLATAELVRDHLPQDTTLRDLGARRLKDLIRPEQIFQVVVPDLPAEFAPLKTLDVHPHNLPVQLTSFIGREQEIGEIMKLLAGAHLLTLTGIGGTGKTRLALQVSADLIDEFPGGVLLVELAPLRDPALVEQTVASVLGIHERHDHSLSDLLMEYLQEKHLLLILDNCEHVVEACAQLSNLLLRNASGLKILATSRVRLNLAGEIIYHVPPLALPDPGRSTPALSLVQYEAIRLFIERAKAVQPSFSVTNENAHAVVQICTHLDGIPLAIELAAARTRFLTPNQISTRLGDRFNLLTGGSRTALPHLQTLQATMDWSYDLLGETERMFFNRLAVFAGSFSLEATEAICPAENGGRKSACGIHPSQVLDLLGALVDHSLINVQERNAGTRYVLLETVRQYALEKLQASGELLGLQDRHLAYYLEFAERGSPHIYSGQPVWIERFETDYDNLRAAMEHAIAHHPESAILFEYPLLWFCDYTWRIRESYDWAMQILALTEVWPPGKLRAMALQHAGDRCSTLGEYQQGQALMEASLEMAKDLGDKNLTNKILYDLVAMSWFQGDWVKMRMFAERNLTIAQELGDKLIIQNSLWGLGESISFIGDLKSGRMYLEQSLKLGREEDHPNIIAAALRSLARVARLEGDFTKARALYNDCAQIYRQIGYKNGVAGTLIDLSQIFLQEGNSNQASAMCEESLAIFRELKKLQGQVDCLAGFAGAAGIEGQDGFAARLFGANEAAAEKFDLKMDDAAHQIYDPIIAAVRERLGEAEFCRAWSEGRKLTLEQAIESTHP